MPSASEYAHLSFGEKLRVLDRLKRLRASIGDALTEQIRISWLETER